MKVPLAIAIYEDYKCKLSECAVELGVLGKEYACPA